MSKKIEIKAVATLPQQFRAAGISAGIKKSGAPDMTLIVSDVADTAAAGTFTKNQFKAAPVKSCMKRIKSGKGRAIVVNSGNANACTGKEGDANAEAMAKLTAKAVGVPASQVYVSSTGHIGTQLPMQKISDGISQLSKKLSAKGGRQASLGIITTDNAPKVATIRLRVDNKPVVLTVLCKGAGMIEPNMATMLCYILTDAKVNRKALATLLKDAVANSFNRISVDGDMSTNDTVLMLANGAAGNNELKPGHRNWKAFASALFVLCEKMAYKIVRDGEGATKVIKVDVVGAKTNADAEKVARAVANSLLVKTSWYNDYPGFGRIMDAIGYSAAKVVENKVAIAYDGKVLVENGLQTNIKIETVKKIQRKELFTIQIDLNVGKGTSYVYGCDCAHAYIDINI